VSVSLPFELGEIRNGESAEFLFEGGIGLLSPESKIDYLILGPLKPCIGIIIRNSENGKILVFHKYFMNNLDSIKPFYQHLEVSDPSKVVVRIHTTALTKNDDVNAWTALHQGRSQKSELLLIKNELIEKFGFPRKNVTASIFTPKFEEMLVMGQHADAVSTLIVNRSGELRNIGLYTLQLKEKAEFNSEILVSAINLFKAEKEAAVRKGLKLGPTDQLPWRKSRIESISAYNSMPPFYEIID
jgi:hypothetical protein